MSDDAHQGYVAAFVTVEFPQVQLLERKLDPGGKDLKLAAVGGNIGLYGLDKAYAKWPVDDLGSTIGLASRVLASVEHYGEPFWQSFPDIRTLDELLDNKHPYTLLQQSRWHLRVAVKLVAHGLERALFYVEEHSEAFRSDGGVGSMRKRLDGLAARSPERPS